MQDKWAGVSYLLIVCPWYDDHMTLSSSALTQVSSQNMEHCYWPVFNSGFQPNFELRPGLWLTGLQLTTAHTTKGPFLGNQGSGTSLFVALIVDQ